MYSEKGAKAEVRNRQLASSSDRQTMNDEGMSCKSAKHSFRLLIKLIMPIVSSQIDGYTEPLLIGVHSAALFWSFHGTVTHRDDPSMLEL